MNENLTELVFILDRSGSMVGREQDTIGGFNGMIEKQKALAGEARVTTVLFDSVSKVLYSRRKSPRRQTPHRKGILRARARPPCSTPSARRSMSSARNCATRRRLNAPRK